MLQKLIPNYELFLRVVGDADPYKSRQKLTAALASFGKGGGFCEAKDGGLEIKNNYFFGGSKPTPYSVQGYFELLIIIFRATTQGCREILCFHGQPQGLSLRFAHRENKYIRARVKPVINSALRIPNSALKHAEVFEQDFKTHQNKNKSARKLCL